MSDDGRPAPSGACLDSDPATLSWPPSEADLAAIACVETTQAVAVVRPPGRTPRTSAPLEPLSSVVLQWPPPAEDLAGVFVIPLDPARQTRTESPAAGATRVPPGDGRRWERAAAAALAASLAVGASAYLLLSPTAPDARPGDVRVAPAEIADARTAATAPAPAAAAPTPVVASPALSSDATGAPPAGPKEADREPVIDEPTAPVATPVLSTADVTLPAAPRDAPEDLAPIVERPVIGHVAADALSGAVPVALGTPPAAPVPAVPREAGGPTSVESRAASSVATAIPREEPAVRDILERYGSAYTRLDARAARAVWPNVDTRALSRAFDALESQSIVFDRCDVTVNGRAAQAACRGTATWVPRVGERRPHREAREWTFRLEKAGDAQWRIQSASMR